MTKLKIYTESYQPFRMGGNLREPISCTVEALGPFDLGKGFEAYVVCDSHGSTVVAEAISGGLVGDTIESVRKDVEEVDEAAMSRQIDEGRETMKRARDIEAAEFWAMRNRR